MIQLKVNEMKSSYVIKHIILKNLLCNQYERNLIFLISSC